MLDNLVQKIREIEMDKESKIVAGLVVAVVVITILIAIA